MSHEDKWGHKSSNELIRQWLIYKGWFTCRGNNFRKVKDINFAATVSLTNGENQIDERLGCNFATIGYTNFAGCHIEHIYAKILT